MNTAYKSRMASPYQAMKEKMMDMQDAENPALQMLQKLCQSRYNLCATFSPDLSVMATLKTPGLVAVKCELLMDNKPIGIGHGSTAISKLNKGLDRALYGCLNGALMSAINVGCKSLDVLRIESAQWQSATLGEAYRAIPGEEESPATDKQKVYLRQLLSVNIEDEEQREQKLQELESYTKSDASDLIKSLLTDSQR